jgi:hypothetical protein
MGPWSKPEKKQPMPAERRKPGEIMLWTALIALCTLGALGAWMSRYEAGTAGAIPTRMNRWTGQVIGCVPLKGCVELVPAGEPALTTPIASHQVAAASPAAEAAPAGAAEPAPAKPADTAKSH